VNRQAAKIDHLGESILRIFGLDPMSGGVGIVRRRVPLFILVLILFYCFS
jgi:uncharacterized protein YjeT (DUF2065 family)